MVDVFERGLPSRTTKESIDPGLGCKPSSSRPYLPALSPRHIHRQRIRTDQGRPTSTATSSGLLDQAILLLRTSRDARGHTLHPSGLQSETKPAGRCVTDRASNASRGIRLGLFHNTFRPLLPITIEDSLSTSSSGLFPPGLIHRTTCLHSSPLSNRDYPPI